MDEVQAVWLFELLEERLYVEVGIGELLVGQPGGRMGGNKI
jgi:hypothetical protein